jgi:uncharacterized membrane protein
VRRRLAAGVAALAISLVAALAPAPAALARSADITDADIEMGLDPYGNLLIVERLTFDYDGSFEGSYRELDLNHGEHITDVSVSQGDKFYEPGGNPTLGSTDRPGVFGTEELFERFRIVWHYRASDEQRTYTIAYRVDRGAVAYDDVIDVGWTVWGDQWDFDLDHLSASFSNPALDADDPAYRVWGHPRDVEGETVRGEGVATLEASDVHSGTAVEFRVTVPRRPGQGVSDARQREGDGLPAILADEQALDDDYNSTWNRIERFVDDYWLLLILGLAALAALAHLPLARLARERQTSTPEYLPEPPDEAPPAMAYGLANEGEGSNNTVLATLLDLVDRGYYDTGQASTEEEKLDLTLQQKEKAKRPTGELTDYEQDVLEFFDQLLDGNKVAMSGMKELIPAHSELWRGRWERMTEKLNAAEDGQLVWDRNLNPVRYGIIFGAAALQVLVGIVHASGEGSIFPSLAIAAATVIGLSAFSDTRFKRLDADHAERTDRWQAFAHWTEDFPRLSDDPPATLELWKRILVYGVAFGTAERMIASGRIPAPVMEASSSSGNWSSYAFVGGFSSGAFDGSSFSSSFASQVAPQSSSSGGGGGFSGGGGGGFSGGGGGGSW